ncbi:hypothetical protein HDF26_002049 [Pedobacter cryoconitis]|uniref:Bacteriocin-like protein n=1 Tax=Pedobacter cryoconitis TaxID=188932 RepID=A0A7W8ZJX6_9SPHI|nr:class I lanthipeptide [Pedobacter cryoconitis]MBB5635225.1 hypothetical protein [Pedobacter cryoconitis]MBB6271592.1 hypothetical protein [Pedobacter cryoconitis]
MKKVNLSNKITLDKEIISKLNDDQLNELEGGKAAGSMSCITLSNQSCVSANCEEAQQRLSL